MATESPTTITDAGGLGTEGLAAHRGDSAFARLLRGPDRAPKRGLSLFWRTFILLSLLLAGSVLAWIKMVSVIETEPRAKQTSQHVVALVNLTRAVLQNSQPVPGGDLAGSLQRWGGLNISPRLPTDRVGAPPLDDLGARIARHVTDAMGPEITVASGVNEVPGMWIGFAAGPNGYWLKVDPSDLSIIAASSSWMVWLVLALALSLAGIALIAGLVNRPVTQLWRAASRVRAGDYDSSFLPETSSTNEIREVNIGFNLMAQRIAKLEEDRAVMLAGISHDLRTPLARLRLESELSVADNTAREHMASDIDQLDRIIDKFLDYARPVPSGLRTVSLNDVVEGVLYAMANPPDMKLTLDIKGTLFVLGDATELSRVLSNLLENARRYGKSADGLAHVEIMARKRDQWVLLRVRDHGPGVPNEDLARIKQPFYRGDLARTAVTGAGLGLAIVDKTVQRMGGSFVLTCPSGGGLSAAIRLNRAPTQQEEQTQPMRV